MRLTLAALLFETLTGLTIALAPFHAAVQWNVLLHTTVGAVTLLPITWYCLRHLAEYRTHATSQTTVLGWVALGSLALVSVSGMVLTVQALFGVRTTALWRQVHLVSTLILLVGIVPHLVVAARRQRKTAPVPGLRSAVAQATGLALLGCAACHKQFIDAEVNRVGWVQLQNQYDNWAASHWNHQGDPHKTIECRECHMPLVASRDPAAGDSTARRATAGIAATGSWAPTRSSPPFNATNSRDGRRT